MKNEESAVGGKANENEELRMKNCRLAANEEYENSKF